MITAVDTSVLIDVFADDERFAEASVAALRDAHRRGAIVACDIVWAEVAAGFANTEDATSALRSIGVDFSPLEPATALDAGMAWRAYRRRGGRRTRVIADVLIAAHARRQADALLSRDRGLARASFEDLTLIDPTP